MSTEKGSVELTNMIMIEDKSSGKVLVQQRVKSWRGISFPGGHVEAGESFVDSAIREVSGKLLAETEEGKVFWVDPSELDKMELAENFDRYLPMFLKGCFCEVYGSWNEDDPQILIYK